MVVDDRVGLLCRLEQVGQLEYAHLGHGVRQCAGAHADSLNAAVAALPGERDFAVGLAEEDANIDASTGLGLDAAAHVLE